LSGKVNKKNQRLPQTHIKSVFALYSNGQIQEALDSIKTFTKDYPDEPLLYNISGACYKAIGQLDAAVKSFKKALAIKPDYSEVNYNLGVTLKELGQLDEAVKCYEKAIASQPDYADPYNNLGSIFLRLDQLDAAVECYEKAIAIQPDYAEAHNNLGLTLKKLDQVDAAVKCYEKAIAIKPDYADPYNNLGSIFMELGQMDDAINSYEKAVAIKPEYAEAHNNLGNAFNKLERLDDSVKCYKKALIFKPDYTDAHYNLGIAFKGLGQIDDAVKCYEKAVAIKPDNAEAHRNLSALKKYTKDDPQITQMQSLVSTSDLSQSDRMLLCFALAKAYEDLGKQDELFKFLHEGNRLRKEDLSYSLDKDQKLFTSCRNLFSSLPSTIENSLSYETSAIQPIFIVGMPRSGTSLVEQIIASHHAVHGAGELSTLSELSYPIINDYSNYYDTNSLLKKAFFSIRQQYLDSLSSFNVSENIITDKMPLNFRYIGVILSAFPEAKIIHLKRDTMATCWSIYKHYFQSRGNGFSYNLEDLAGFYDMYIDLMAFWHQLYSDKIYDLCYEDLTTNQEEETRKLLEYCELDWDENCLNFHTNNRVVKTASALQVRQKMYQGSSKVWKQHEAYLQPLIKALSSY
jgi:tetratricopeptide (TPR) repeat protein